MIDEDKFHALGQFLGAYFHQDWMHIKVRPDWTLENADADSVVRWFIASEPASSVRKAAEEIEELLSLGMDESQLEQAIFEDLGSYYLPTADGMSYNEWLRHVHGLLVEALRE